MLRVASLNINGIRAGQRRGFGPWLAGRGCDVVGLQEVRCPVAALPADAFGDYHLTYDAGALKGRNGVAVLTRERPEAVRTWSGSALLRQPGALTTELTPAPVGVLARGLHEFAAQGRYLEVDLAGVPVTLASVYVPKGGLPAHLQRPGRMREAPDGGARYERKMRFLAAFERQVRRARRAARARGREYVLVGDLNIAHTRFDVVNWRRNQRSEGFLPSEREWLDGLIGPRRLVDVVRRLHPEVDGPYSWWSWLGESFTNDAGWRIDYQLATPGLARRAVAAGTDRDPAADRRISDHAPVVVDYAL
ncbi:exodeoxyribonuclease-3 [Kineosphaera limosa]|uniref:Putative exodeoxyribonuclease n=1 Tax=Kineosphaera limosa NBRC 100340 TaxID=1184609 RepID=K6XHM9_9MICO|nr:exodeoxyribonuclease III [Kineosphaera limosa]NYE00671.1 exodeoxyribonuclease-3 [Kineosphaera limosa]GAB98314.1 putative exodeoxyribonuclease [Kineosphaera limosa NBRC 100340]